MRLRTEIAAVTTENNNSEGAVPSLRDNRIALKARVSGLEAKSNQQAETIQRLRAEVAQANERAARQASNFMDEMRRLGMAAHVTQTRTGRPQDPAKAATWRSGRKRYSTPHAAMAMAMAAATAREGAPAPPPPKAMQGPKRVRLKMQFPWGAASLPRRGLSWIAPIRRRAKLR